MKTVTVLGWYDQHNIGDEAYKAAFPKLFPDFHFNFTNQLSGTVDLLILGGGDVLNKAFISQVDRYPTARKFAMSVSVTGDAVNYLNRFEGVVSRDIVPFVRPNFVSLPDFSFALESNPERGKRLLREAFNRNGCDLYENVVAVVMNSFLCHGESQLARDHVNFDRVCFELAKVIDSTNASFVFLPFGNGFPFNDCIANGILYSRCKFWRKNLLWLSYLGVQDCLDMCGAANAMIGTRLHSLIFSCIGGVPFIDLSHHDKTKSFMKTVGKEDWSVNYWNFCCEKVAFLLKDFLANNSAYKEAVRTVAAASKEQLARRIISI